MTLKVIETFSGIGTQAMALRNIGVDYEVVAISEIDKYAIASYEVIHGKTNNLGDISQVDTADVPDCDLLTYSFPCTDLSHQGSRKGFKKGSGTSSSLLWEVARLIEAKRPKYLLMENVSALIHKTFIRDFRGWVKQLEEWGYTSYYDVLNAKHFGVPQNRERVFMVSVLGEHEPYTFPKGNDVTTYLEQVLEADNMDRYISDDLHALFPDTTLYQRDRAMLEGGHSYLLYDTPKKISERKNWSFNSSWNLYSRYGVSPTLTASCGGGATPIVNVLDSEGKHRTRTIHPIEAWRLTGIRDEDFYRASKVVSNSQLMRQAGNAIVVDVLEAIFRNMFQEVPEEDLIGRSIPLF